MAHKSHEHGNMSHGHPHHSVASKAPHGHSRQHAGSGASSQSIKHKDPDHGPGMQEGPHHFDKGYVSDNESFSPMGVYPGHHQRGNRYANMQNDIAHRDSRKLSGEKFSKIA